MPDLGPHAAYILGAYGLAALVVGGLVGWVLAEGRRQARRLAALDARGLRRGSGERGA